MTELLQQRIADALSRSFNPDHPVSWSDLTQANMPEGLRHFLTRSLQRRLHLESQQALEGLNGWVDPDHTAAQDAAHQAAQLLQDAAQFPAAEWSKASTQAVTALVSYLQEPAQTLADFAYQSDAQSVADQDLRRRTGYFSDYSYMVRAVDAWLTSRSGETVERDAFESAMVHLDVRMTEDHDVNQWMALLQPLLDLVTFAGIQPVGLPVDIVVRFFEAKDRPAIASQVRSAAAVHKVAMITAPSLREIIQKGLDNERLRESQQAAPTDQTSESIAATPQSGALPSHSEDADKESLPLWKRFQQRVDGPSDSSSGAAASHSPSASGASQPLWKSFENPAAEPGSAQVVSQDVPNEAPEVIATPVPEVPIQEATRLEAQHIVLGTTVRSRDRFIHALFGGSEPEFSEVMEELAEAPDWTTASAIIADRVFRPHRIDIYSDVAVDFTNAVEARYSGMTS